MSEACLVVRENAEDNIYACVMSRQLACDKTQHQFREYCTKVGETDDKCGTDGRRVSYGIRTKI